MRRTGLLGVSFGAAALGVLLTVLGTALVVSRASNERSQVDRSVASSAAENAALIDAELQRIQALALVTSRIPPFSELYADKGSQAAQIAAVAGPHREINDALRYLWRLYPDRLVEVSYVDVDGSENARVVNGVAVPVARLSRDVRATPSYRLGVSTPPGTAAISTPFVSPTAHVPVVATTVAVQVDDRVRAYVELELATAALDRVMAADRQSGIGLAVIGGGAGTTVAHAGAPGKGAGSPRVATRPVPQTADWQVVATARSESPLTLLKQPAQAAILVLALLMLALAAAGIRRSRSLAARQFAAEQKARAEAEQRSRVDPLTGLFNRRHTMETIERELDHAADGPGVGVLMVDVDHFKRVNDRHGHSGGDAVLVEVAKRLQQGVRDGDVVARIGGEEFCVIAPGLDGEDAVAALGERLRQAVAEQPVGLADGVRIPVTVSAGAAIVAGDGGSAEQAIDVADRALYAAKRHGRNQVRRFSEVGAMAITSDPNVDDVTGNGFVPCRYAGSTQGCPHHSAPL